MSGAYFMYKTVLAAVAVVGAVSSPAQAAVTISTNFAANNPATSLPIFQSFGTGIDDRTAFVPNSGPGYNPAATNSGNPVESVAPGSLVRYYSSATVPGESVGPVPLVGSYISINNGTYSVAFSGVQVLSFVFAALDSYNTVRLNYIDGATGLAGSQSLDGLAICGGAATLGCAIQSSGRVTYDFGGTGVLTSVDFITASPAFEIDGLAAAAPEPATWLMMILGFGLVGGALRRRKVSVRFATA